MMTISLREFVIEQKCIPWKLRLLLQKIIPWQVRRFLTHGKINLNTPDAMDKRYSSQGDDFVSMENLYAHILTLIPSRGRLLDAGCGIAVLLRMIRNRYPQLELFGVDFSSVAVQRTRNYGFAAEQTVLPDLPYSDDFFDCIVSTEVLEHLNEPEKTIRSFHRVVRTGGCIIATVPDGMGPDHCDEHVQDFTSDELIALFENNGFVVRSLEVIEREPARKPGASFVIVGEKV